MTYSQQMNRVLIVDDQPNIIETLSDILEDRGYDVRIADNGLIALELLEEAPVDFILMDLMMPGLNGIETFRRLKSRFPLIPVVMMTGFQGDPLLKEAIEEGVLAVLQKPVNPDVLLKVARLVLMPNEEIMVLDNDAAMLGMLTDVLSRKGYRVVCAKERDQALNLARSKRFDVLFLSLREAVVASEVFGEFVQHQPDVPMIVVTDSPHNSMLPRTFSKLSYPCNPAQAARSIQRVLVDSAIR